MEEPLSSVFSSDGTLISVSAAPHSGKTETKERTTKGRREKQQVRALPTGPRGDARTSLGPLPSLSERAISIVATVVNLLTELAVGKPLAAVSGSASFANRTHSQPPGRAGR